MTQLNSPELWVYGKGGVYKFCREAIWESIVSACAKRGWEAPSETEIMWLESPLAPYKRGSFFTAEDARSFAEALQDYMEQSARDLSPEIRTLLLNLKVLLATGPVFIRLGAPNRTMGTGHIEVVHVYLCPQCGFMHHGSWFFETDEGAAGNIESSVAAMLQFKYCPLCSATTILSEAFILPPVDPENLPRLETALPA